jgi:hypothetical protein
MYERIAPDETFSNVGSLRISASTSHILDMTPFWIVRETERIWEVQRSQRVERVVDQSNPLGWERYAVVVGVVGVSWRWAQSWTR